MKHFAFLCFKCSLQQFAKADITVNANCCFPHHYCNLHTTIPGCTIGNIAKHDPCLIKASLSSTQVIQTQKQLNAKLHVY